MIQIIKDTAITWKVNNKIKQNQIVETIIENINIEQIKE